MTFEEKLEDELTTLLTGVLDAQEAIAAPLPDNIDDFFKVHEQSRIWVGYQSSDFDEKMKDIVGVVQDDTVLIIITLQARKRRGEKGIYALRKQVHDTLVGYTPTDFTRKLYNSYFGPPKTEGVPLLNAQQWTFEYHLKAERISVQGRPEPDNFLTQYQSSSTVADLQMPATDIPTPPKPLIDLYRTT